MQLLSTRTSNSAGKRFACYDIMSFARPDLDPNGFEFTVSNIARGAILLVEKLEKQEQ